MKWGLGDSKLAATHDAWHPQMALFLYPGSLEITRVASPDDHMKGASIPILRAKSTTRR